MDQILGILLLIFGGSYVCMENTHLRENTICMRATPCKFKNVGCRKIVLTFLALNFDLRVRCVVWVVWWQRLLTATKLCATSMYTASGLQFTSGMYTYQLHRNTKGNYKRFVYCSLDFVGLYLLTMPLALWIQMSDNNLHSPQVSTFCLVHLDSSLQLVSTHTNLTTKTTIPL